MRYKWCVVPQCTNTSIKSPQKLFVSVPTNPKRRRKWLQLSRRDPNSILSHTNVFMCEDHFDMDKDTTNYMKYKMGFSKNILLSDEAVPTKFHCQEDRRRQQAGPSQELFIRSQTIELECPQSSEEKFLVGQDAETAESLQKQDNMFSIIIEPDELPTTQDRETITDPVITAEKSIQVKAEGNVYYTSKSEQTRCLNKSISTTQLELSTTSGFTFPVKTEPGCLQPSQSGVVKAVERKVSIKVEKADSDISSSVSGSSSFVVSTLSRFTDSDGNITDTNENIEQLQCLSNTVCLIKKKPMMHVGISKECYFLIHLMHKHTVIKTEHILLCLKKIRLNKTFAELEDDFGISDASKLFLENVPILSSFLRPFIVNLDKTLKNNLLIVIKHNYHNVSCIIDCLEIDIQKPSKSVYQALPQSEYKKGTTNTVKYVISCTPNGLVNYVSHGFEGSTSDITMVENCNFLDGLQQGSCILAIRGFEHLETVVQEKGIKLLRPPSVNPGSKLSKTEVRQTKIIASLQIHIERVIKRLREFNMLKQHSVIDPNILPVLDYVIIIACALINLQD